MSCTCKLHFKEHDDTHGIYGNEKVDDLTKQGVKIRFNLIELTMSHDWFRCSVLVRDSYQDVTIIQLL